MVSRVRLWQANYQWPSDPPYYLTVDHLEEDTEGEGESDGHQTPGQAEQEPAEHPDTGVGSFSVIWTSLVIIIVN